MIAYGKNDTLYRIGRDFKLYVYLDNKQMWSRIGNKDIYRVSASSDALWIIESGTKILYKFDEMANSFI
jgi:hypothetical protein